MASIQAIPSSSCRGPPLAKSLEDTESERHLISTTENLSQSANSCPPHWEGNMDLPSIHTVQTRQNLRTVGLVRQKCIRQILGLNPFRTSYWSLYKTLTDFRSKSYLVLGTLLAIAAGMPLPLIGVILGKIINNFPPDEHELRTRLSQLMGVAVAYFLVTWGWSVCWAMVGERVSRKTREQLVERILGMDLAYFDTVSPDVTGTLTEKTQAIQLGTSEKVGLFIASISYFVTAFAVGFTLNARLTAMMYADYFLHFELLCSQIAYKKKLTPTRFATVIPAMTTIVVCGTTFASKFSKQASSFTEKATIIAESAFKGVQIVQAFGVLDRLAEDHIVLLRKALRAGVKKSITGAVMLGSIYCIAYAANALAFWYGNHLRQGSAEAGTIYAVIFLILDASFVVGQFGPFIQTFASAAAAGQAVFDILDHSVTEIDVYSDKGKSVKRSDFRNTLKLRGVSFVYPSRPTERVLQNVDLDIPSGKVTGLVGPSGSGKSTIASLVLRLYDPLVGTVFLGGDNFKDLNIRTLRSQVALVTQNPVLFSGTILDNIRLGLPEDQLIPEHEAVAKCTAAASEAYCDFLEHLPDGLNTKIGSGHDSQLSGGQKQRIALARALVGNPALLLLDEYTSAMDATSETRVLESLRRSSSQSGRTTVIIAHRLATVKYADNIVVMKSGGVIEQGCHDSLIKINGVYSELIRAQQFEKKAIHSSKSSFVSSTRQTKEVHLMPNIENTSTLPVTLTTAGELQSKNTVQLISRCCSLSRNETAAIAIGLVASIVCGTLILLESYIFGNIVELLNVRSDPQLASRVSFYCLLFFLLALLALFAHSSSGTAFGFVSENLVLRVRDVSFRTVLMQDMEWFSLPGNSHHALMAKLNMDSGHLSGLSGVILGTFFSISTSVIGGIIMAHIIAWKIAVVLLSAVPIMLVAGFFRLRVLANAQRRHETAYNSAAALASEACSSIHVVAALGKERVSVSQHIHSTSPINYLLKYFLKRYCAAVQGPYQESLRCSVFSNIMLAFSLSITYFVYALAYWWYAVIIPYIAKMYR